MWSDVARRRGATFGLLQRVACESANPASPIFPGVNLTRVVAVHTAWPICRRQIRTDMSVVGPTKFLSATCGADESSLIVAASSTSLFTPTDNVGRRFSCRPTKIFVQPMRGSDFVADKSASVNSALHVGFCSGHDTTRLSSVL